MSKLEWGKKLICSKCTTKFYDMRKPQPECPNCGSQILLSRKPRVGRPPLSHKKVKNIPIEPAVKKEIPSEITEEKELNEEEQIENIEDIGEIENIEEMENFEEIEEIETIDEIEEPADPTITKKIETEKN